MATRQYYCFDLRQKVISTRGDNVPAPFTVARAGAAAGSTTAVAVPQSIGYGYLLGQSAGAAAVSGLSQTLFSGAARAVGAAAGATSIVGYGVRAVFSATVGAVASAAAASAVGAGARVVTGAGSSTAAGSASAAAVGSDGLRAYVSLLVPADGTNGATTAPDRSVYARTLTGTGVATLSTARRKTGSASLAFGDTLYAGGRFTAFQSAALPAEFALQSSDFTLQLSYYMSVVGDPDPAVSDTVRLFTLGRHWLDTTTGAAGVHGFALEWDTNGALRAKFTNGQAAGAVTSIEVATTAPYNRFADLAVTKAGANLYLHVDGGLVGQTVLPGGGLSFPTLVDCTLGGALAYSVSTGAHAATYGGVGNIDEARLTVGVARLGAANYTPSPDPFPTY